MTTFEYFGTEETTRRRELAHGILREPPAPFFTHQTLVLRVARLLCDHVEPRGLGRVGVAPIDVVLDAEAALVVQPDVLFIAADRLSIIREQVWGAPDLVVEILSPGTEHRDRGEKLGWYRQYGVRECWIVDPRAQGVEVMDFSGALPERRAAYGADSMRSTVFPALQTTAFALFV